MAVSFDIVTMALHHLQLVPYPQSQPKSGSLSHDAGTSINPFEAKILCESGSGMGILLKRIIEADRRALQFFLALIIYIRLVW